MPSLEPPFSVGVTPSPQPTPRFPSVQENPYAAWLARALGVPASWEVRVLMTVDREQALVGFPATFSYSEARRRGLGDRRLYALRDSGVLEQLGRGLYRRTDLAFAVDPDLLEIAHRAARATLCLTTALAQHGLTDTIPASMTLRRRAGTATHAPGRR